MKIEELDQQQVKKKRSSLKKNCKEVMIAKPEKSRSCYNVFFATQGKYKGLSVLAKDSEENYYYYGPFESVKE